MYARTALIAALVILTVAVPAGRAEPPLVSLDDVHADPAGVTVSGISSGGYMAHQFHVAFADSIAGAGIVAGGPYRCAAHGPSPQFDCNAITLCTRFPDRVPWWYCPSLPHHPRLYGRIPFSGPPAIAPLVHDTQQLAQEGAIAAPAFLCGDRVLLLTGEFDEAVPESVVRSLGDYYAQAADCREGTPAPVVEIRQIPGAAHTMPIVDRSEVDWPCGTSEPPYLGECGVSAAAAILDFLYGHLPAAGPSAPPAAGRLVRFRQSDVVPGRIEARAGLLDTGYLYVPEACEGDARCPLHVVFHGCRQSVRSPDTGEAFVRYAGYNDWADAHRTIILYPQVHHPRYPGDFFWASNPRGCWDFWGYAGSGFATRSGPQMAAVKAMIDRLTAGGD